MKIENTKCSVADFYGGACSYANDSPWLRHSMAKWNFKPQHILKFQTSAILPIAPILSSDYVTAGSLTPNWHHFHWINIWSLTLRLETAKKSIRPIRYRLLLIVLTPSPTCDNALCNSVDSARSNFKRPRASARSSLLIRPWTQNPTYC